MEHILKREDKDSMIMHAMAGTRHLEWWHDYFRMLFKYRNNDPAVGSLHTDLMDRIVVNGSKSRFGKWWEHNDEFRVWEKLDKGVIKGHLNNVFMDEITDSVDEMETSLRDHLLKDAKSMISTLWGPKKWMSSAQFNRAVNVFAKSTAMTGCKYCYRCGGNNSVEHSLRTCEKLDEECIVDIEKMIDNEEDCMLNSNRLESLYKDHARNTLFTNLGRHLATAHLNGEDVDILCIAPVNQDTRKYRIMYLDGSKTVVTLDLFNLHKQGCLYVNPELVALEDYIL